MLIVTYHINENKAKILFMISKALDIQAGKTLRYTSTNKQITHTIVSHLEQKSRKDV